MRPLRSASLVVLTLVVLACGAAAVARGAAEHRAPALSTATRLATPAAPADSVLLVISRVDANVPQAAFDTHLTADVQVRVHVTTSGLPDSAVALDGPALLRADAAGAARWWIFVPPAQPAWTTVRVAFDGRADIDPLPFDILGMAHDDEAAAQWQGALDAWSGALVRVGVHPTLRNPWAIREHCIRIAQRMPGRPRLSQEMEGSATTARGQQGHVLAAYDQQQLADQIDSALNAAPWWAEAYQWRASSLALAGRGLDAMRSTELFRIGARDSAERSLASRALARFAAGDTLGAAMLLQKEGRQFNTDRDAGE